MARRLSMKKAKCYTLFLNACFLFIVACLITSIVDSPESDFLLRSTDSAAFLNDSEILERDIGCKGLPKVQDHQAKCLYVRSHEGCLSNGYISYLKLFYCVFDPVLAYSLFVLWLLVLFYLLGDTAAKYFCLSLEGLSSILRLSPSIAGVTLLSLGNGSPDLFSSLVSFTGDATKDVGLNSILGGGFFVTSTVVGIISLSASQQGVSISRSSFMRDVLFLIFSLFCLLVIVAIGSINLWGAIAFLSLYFLYIFFVAVSRVFCRDEKEEEIITGSSPILPVHMSFCSDKSLESSDAETPLLPAVDEEGNLVSDAVKTSIQYFNGKWWVGSYQKLQSSRTCWLCKKSLQILQLPLDLPRKLTIPVISGEEWSKMYAVVSVTVAPVFLAAVWNLSNPDTSLMVYAIGGSMGIVFGLTVYFTTECSNPPTNCLFLYFSGGFLMSIVWTYMLAQELISLIVSLGLVLGINPSILGLTVLAWGNSLGDLVANVTMAKNGGPSGVQVALSGCYAGPIFNLVIGLGLSLSFLAWKKHPSPYTVPKDPFVYETVGFFIGGLLWALIVLPKRKMRVGGQLGVGLLAIYFCFLFLKLARTLGILENPLS